MTVGSRAARYKSRWIEDLGSRVSCVDVFCGVGGLTYGLARRGIEVAAGIDLDPDSRYPYETNNSGKFLERDVADLAADDVARLFPRDSIRLLAGCAPCQPFSNYSQGREPQKNPDWGLLSHFGRLVKSIQPELVTMENVPQLEQHSIFQAFLTSLKGYEVWHSVINCADFGIPQSRNRFVLLASKLGPIRMVSKSLFGKRRTTVRSAIGTCPPIEAGERHHLDNLHVAADLEPRNLQRIRKSIPGGTWRDWNQSLRTKCHKRKSGKGYAAVYGRMEWGKPAPTITTQCYNFGSGRFGHPEQDRAITLREAAILQTFPKDYAFVEDGRKVRLTTVGRLIGNAVPPRLGEVIAESFYEHLRALAA